MNLEGMSIEQEINQEAMPEVGPEIQQEEENGGLLRLLELIKGLLFKETGPGEIEEYVTHPFNFSKSMGMAQILRGFTGLLGHSLKLAVLDILLGWWRWQVEKRSSLADAPGPAGTHS